MTKDTKTDGMKKKPGRKVVVTCAVTGSVHTPSMSPHLPITPDQIASEAIAAAEAGASILHLHARDPEDGPPFRRPGAVHAVSAAHQAVDRCGGEHLHRRLLADEAGRPHRRSAARGSPKCARSTWAR